MRLFPQLKLLAWVVVLLLGISGAALADDIYLDFTGGAGGTMSYAGHSAPLVGRNIQITNLFGVGTPLHSTASELTMHPEFANGAFGVVNGRLNLETGAFSGLNADGDYLFSGGGYFTITGAVQDHSGGYIISDPSTVLLRGSLLGAEVDRVGRVKLTIVTGTDTKHPDLVSWFGLPADTAFVFSGEILTGSWSNASRGYAVTQSRITNTVVPEPATITLLGSIIFLVGTRLRRKLR
jgi:hypothetical protein